jgi:hypothetical protein
MIKVSFYGWTIVEDENLWKRIVEYLEEECGLCITTFNIEKLEE